MKILIPNLAIGNFASILRMIQRTGRQARLIDDPRDLTKADRILLAGVGAFDAGMRNLLGGGWQQPLNEAVLERRVPVLGICLGMQLLGRGSEEGELPGLGWIDAYSRRFRANGDVRLKIPHMGWNTVEVARPNSLIPGDGEQRFYFVHSYYLDCAEQVTLARAHHGHPFVAAVAHGNVFGVQFHPEKSHRFGLELLSNFVNLEC